MGCCASQKADKQQNLVYKRLINQVYNTQHLSKDSKLIQQVATEQLPNIIEKPQDQMKQDFQQKTDFLQSIDAHVKITYKALRDHLQDNQHRLTDSVMHIDEIQKKNLNNPYQMFITLKLLDFMSQDIEKFTSNLKVKKQFLDEEPSRIDNNISIGNASQQQPLSQRVQSEQQQEMMFLSDNFIQFENHYIQILDQIFQETDLMKQYCIESILNFTKNRKHNMQSENVYNILQQLIKLVKDDFENLKNIKFCISKQLEEYRTLIEGFQSTCKKLPLGQKFFDNITEDMLHLIFNLIIVMNQEDQKQQQQQQKTNQEIVVNKNDQTKTEASDEGNIFKVISNQCYEIIGIYAQRAFIQKSYGKLLNPFFKLFDQLEWNDNLDIERVITMTIQISIKESVQLNYEVYLLGKIIGYIGSGDSTQKGDHNAIKQMQSIFIPNNVQQQQQPLEEYNYIFKNCNKPYIKIRSLKLLGQLLHRDKKDQYYLYFQLEKVLYAIIQTITTEVEQEVQKINVIKEEEAQLYKNKKVVEQVKVTFRQLVSGLAPDSRSLIDVIGYLTNSIYQNTYNSIFNDDQDFLIQQYIIFDLIDICLSLVNQFSQTNPIRDDIVLNLIQVQKYEQFQLRSFKILQGFINAQLMNQDTQNKQKEINSAYPDQFQDNEGLQDVNTPNHNDYEINEQYFILYDNSMKFILASFINILNQCEFSNESEIENISKIAWQIMLIFNKVLGRKDQYNFRHLKFLIISFGIYILQKFQEELNQNQNLSYIQKCKNEICFGVLSTIAHSCVCKGDNQFLKSPNGSPQSKFQNAFDEYYENEQNSNNNNNNEILAYVFNENFKNLKTYSKEKELIDDMKYKCQQVKQQDILNKDTEQQCNNLLDYLKNIEEHNKISIQGSQFNDCIENYKKELSEWQEKISGDNMNDITDEILPGNNHHNVNGVSQMSRSANKRQSFVKVGNQQHKDNNNKIVISSFQQIQNQHNINNNNQQTQEQEPADTSFEGICKMIKQKKGKKQIIDLNEIDIQYQ